MSSPPNDVRPPNAPASPALEAVRAMFGDMKQQAASRNLSLRPPPPEPNSCCGRGCNGCVWEGFFAAAEYWREQAQAQLTV